MKFKLLVMDLEVKGERKKRAEYDQPKIKRGSLTMGTWRSSWDASVCEPR